MAEVMSDFHGELNDVLSKVNSWALGREKDLLSLQAEHTSFLDTHNGAPARRPPPAVHSPQPAARRCVETLRRGLPPCGVPAHAHAGLSRHLGPACSLCVRPGRKIPCHVETRSLCSGTRVTAGVLHVCRHDSVAEAARARGQGQVGEAHARSADRCCS